MDRLIYTALTGLQRAQEAQGVTAHNLANAQVPGFRREMASLAAGYLTPGGAAGSARVQSGGEAPNDLLNAGRIDSTGRPLDIAMNGEAWLTVADAQGAEALTRRGDLRFSPEGALLTGDGRPVMGLDGPIEVGAGFSAVQITADGRVETRAAADAPFVEVARLRLVIPDRTTMSRGEDGLFRSPAAEPDATATVTVGALERSNVEPAQALVELVQQSRSFEMQTKLLSAAREMDEAGASLMRLE
jgi:flagellar basal-body rod protein FlgF